jgi:hypothetical protein
LPDGHAHGAVEQARRGIAASGLDHFIKPFFGVARLGFRDDPHRDRVTMKSPTALVTAALLTAILVAASCLIAAGTRGEEAPLRAPVSEPYDHS